MDWIIVAILILIFLYTFIPDQEPESPQNNHMKENGTKDP
jgi:hypothetical protein